MKSKLNEVESEPHADKAAPRNHIRAWRKHRGFTQVDLAERIGIDRTYLTKIETGNRHYSQLVIESIAVVLQCAVADLIGRHPGYGSELESYCAFLAPVDQARALKILKLIFDENSESEAIIC
jgi:transcriptional regulator with XRE-family HTH domain